MICGFGPLADHDARVLILGTIPSARSLAQSQYYAHPQNRFWPIMEQLFGGGERLEYAARVELLRRAKVALWDVVNSGERQGSLDSAIVPSSVVANDIARFLRTHPDIHTVFFNGAKAETLFRKYVSETLPADAQVRFVRLPSTSPAHAALSLEDKMERWKVVAEAVRMPGTPQRA